MPLGEITQFSVSNANATDYTAECVHAGGFRASPRCWRGHGGRATGRCGTARVGDGSVPLLSGSQRDKLVLIFHSQAAGLTGRRGDSGAPGGDGWYAASSSLAARCHPPWPGCLGAVAICPAASTLPRWLARTSGERLAFVVQCYRHQRLDQGAPAAEVQALPRAGCPFCSH
jgi:hypothetical protein